MMTISASRPFAFRLAHPVVGKLGVAIRDHDLRSRLRQRFRAGKSDSLTAAGHDGCLPVQFEFFQIHLLVFLFAYRGAARRPLMS